MNKQFAILMIGLFFLSSCQSTTLSIPTRSRYFPTLIPSQEPTSTLTPILTAFPSQTPLIPYPTSSMVKANAVAFFAEDALWIANVDGSGEKKLADGLVHDYRYFMRHDLGWSPNGKWLNYVLRNELWIISQDGLVTKKLFGQMPDYFQYIWSPDSSKIAYIYPDDLKKTQTPIPGPTPTSVGTNSQHIGMIDVATGKVSKLAVYTVFDDSYVRLSWFPDGQKLLLAQKNVLAFFRFLSVR